MDLDLPWAGHKYFVYDLIRAIEPRTIVELGTYKGTSFFSMCQAVKDSGIDTNLHSVDTWRGDKHAGYYGDVIYKKFCLIKNDYYKNLKIKIHRKLFDDACSSFKESSIDILHIDGLHTYEAVKHDYTNWKKKLSKNGIVLFHDTNEKQKGFGVYILWNEVKKEHFYIEFLHSHGLGVLFKERKFKMVFEKFYKKLFVDYYSNRYQIKLNEFIIAKDKEKFWEVKKKNSDIANINNEMKLELVRKNNDLKLMSNELFRLHKKELEFETFKKGKIWKVLKKYRKIKSYFK